MVTIICKIDKQTNMSCYLIYLYIQCLYIAGINIKEICDDMVNLFVCLFDA